MDEKKLTDEEALKVVLCCYVENSCDDCPLNSKDLPCNFDLNENFLNIIQGLQRVEAEQKAEIERLTREKSQSAETAVEVLEQNLELQKQVDELKERYLEESKERCEFEQRYKKIQHAHNIGLGTQRKHWEKKVQQVEKDTAKEIFETIFNDCWAIKDENGRRIFVESKIKDYAKKCYGVEVE